MRPFNVLFLCTGNSARSVLAEAYLNAKGRGRFVAHSAGSHPTGKINPFAIDLLQRNRIDTSGLRSKSWNEFAATDAPQLDFVITVCDNAAGETCPFWPGQPITAHWGVPDPAAVQGTDDEKRRAFLNAFTVLSTRINYLLALPIEKLDRLTLKTRLAEIGGRTTAALEADRAV
jgi:arsenate reductase